MSEICTNCPENQHCNCDPIMWRCEEPRVDQAVGLPFNPEGSSFGVELAMRSPFNKLSIGPDLEAMLKHHALIPQNAVVVDARWLPAGSYKEFSFPPRESATERLTKALSRGRRIIEKHNEGRQ